jgi:hypothetical protein
MFCVIRLEASKGMKMVFGPWPFLAMELRVSRYRICMAAGVLRILAASRISFAESTSALAAITRDSPSRLACAADEREACSSGENWISLMRIDSIFTPQILADGSMTS